MSEKSIHTVTFTGNRNDWRLWSNKFLAVAEKSIAILQTDPEGLGIKIDILKKLNMLIM